MGAIWLEGVGINALAVDLKAAGPKAVERAKVVVEKSGHDVVAGAQAICPVDTGNLRSSIGVDFDGDGLGWDAGPTASYGLYVEYGTRYMAPQAYMGPAFDRVAADVQPLLEQIADGIL
ncbi:MAG: HK97-gp10 family putative phage morphogenesis protein [Actinoallomurus sp.]